MDDANRTPEEQERTRLAITRHYPVAPEKVWRAWTDPQALALWFGPANDPEGTTADIDLRVGGRYRISFVMPDGEVQESSGTYEQVELNRKLVFNFSWKGSPERVSLVTIEMKPVGGGTEMHFTHERFFDESARNNHAKGWPLFFDSLGNHFQQGA